MKLFIVYNGKGEILRTGGCGEESFEMQANPDDGEFVMEGKASDVNQYILNGEVVDKTPLPVEVVTTDTGVELITKPQVQVSIDKREYGVSESGVVRITKQSPIDTYTVRLSLFPYLSYQEVI